ncbi:MAG: phosphoserine phosphatase SerB [Proteobacteria bacterium]|nr:phosphoserine phosphatase SerB [Pseudomonadota bacterium]MDA1024225.1 phosphoserine phosphatase SerB [Pseudomonadota bacterium]
MSNVLTLIAAAGALSDTHVAAAAEALNRLGAETNSPDWLSDAEACDVAFQGLAAKDAEKAVQGALKDAPVDLCCGPVAVRRKKILVADMDSTIITSETLDELAGRAGRKAETAVITERAMRGEIEFQDALRQRVAMLAGLEETALAETLAGIRLSDGAATLVRTMAQNGAHTVLVSGGFRDFTGPVAAMAGFAGELSNRFEIADGRLTGRVLEPIQDSHAKLQTLTGLADEKGIPLSATLAIGDGANDVPMIEAAGLGIAYKGKPVARAAADAAINHTDLRAALFMQGYRRGEFSS